GVAAVVRRESGHRKAALWLTGACAAAALGDGLVSAAAAGQIRSLNVVTAVLWAAAGYGLAAAAEGENGRPETAKEPPDPTSGGSWLVARVALPLAAVLALPTVAIAVWLVNGRLEPWKVAYFGSFFFVALVIAFGRQ